MAEYPERAKEFGILKSIIMRYRNLLMSRAEFEVFMFICDRLYSFYKFGENIRPSHFHGMYTPKFFHPGLNKDPSRVRHLKIDLIHKKLLFRINPNFYIPNVYGITKLFLHDLNHLMNDKEHDALYALLPLFTREFPKIQASIKPVEEEMARIEEAVEEGRERSRKAKIRKRKKVDQKPEEFFKPSDVRRLFNSLIEEFYEGTPYMEHWTAKIRGQAKNWLNEMKELDQSPKEILRQVVENWSVMRVSLKNDYGGLLELVTIPNFTQFYRHKLKIYDYLIEHRHDKPEEDIVWIER